MKYSTRWFLVILLVGVTLIIIGLIIGITTPIIKDKQTVKIPCYDNHNNLIKGLECEKENINYTLYYDLSVTLGTLGLLLFISAFFIKEMMDWGLI